MEYKENTIYNICLNNIETNKYTVARLPTIILINDATLWSVSRGACCKQAIYLV